MSFSIKCFWAGHDWETIRAIRERDVLKSMKGEDIETRLATIDFKFKTISNGLPLFHHKDGELYKQKICLNCCAIKDEIAEYIREVNGDRISKEFEKFQADNRQKQANSMSKSCAADKFVRI